MSLPAPSPQGTRGVLSHQGVCHCILPRVPPQSEGLYFEAGPRLSAPTDAQGYLINPQGDRIDGSVALPFAEQKLWVASDQLVTVKDWPVYPFSHQIFELPLEVVEQIFERTSVWLDGSAVAAEVDWGGIVLRRSFTLGQLGAGIAAWPPRILPDWQDFYFLFAPGTRELFETSRVPLFEEREPLVYGVETGPAGPRVAVSEVRLVGARIAALCRLAAPPRWISFRSRRDPAVTHGILPIDAPNGELRMPRPDGRWRHYAVAPRRREAAEERIYVAVDFGTANTAIALATGAAASTRRLGFTPRSRAVNLTAPAGLDPTAIPELRLRFFPLATEYTNPMPSILMEFRDVEPFSGSVLLPCRAIPPLAEDERASLIALAQTRNLKQNFKWRSKDEGGPDQRRAFMEHLALAVGWELRAQEPSAARLEVVFTRPLAFGVEEQEQSEAAAAVFRETLGRCGLELADEGRRPISESLANFSFVSARDEQGHGGTDERHVVIDVGGGTTDISVFTDGDHPLLLDSLYVGGKDLAEAFLGPRLGDEAEMRRLGEALGLAAWKADGARDAGEVLQWQLISLMASGGERGVARLAERFNEHQMRDVLGQMIALLVFATLYAVRMAILPRPEDDLPAARKVWIQYAGLGSRLFRLCPLEPGQVDRWRSAKQLLRRAVLQLPGAADIELAFQEPLGKMSVCEGALLALFAQPAAGADESLPSSPQLKTAWWADYAQASPPIRWSDLYDDKRIARLEMRDIERLTIEPLFDCFRIAVEEAGKLGFDDHWQPDPKRLQGNGRELADRFIRACKAIRRNERHQPSHPVRFVTDTAKAAIAKLLA